ncbi:MAG: hydantoinase B/oxoprolinase family protein [Candidatus Tectomicrobia bacterium]|nr:hydantoinase B/oxoprolinase family protein [Candidatus Tectomicrobia bacterium]
MLMDFSLLDQVKPEPITQYEYACMEKLQLGDYEIYSEKLQMICQESKEVLTRLGVSAFIHAGDIVTAIYSPVGDQVVAVLGTYLHCITGIIPIKFILRYWKDNPTVGVREGDIFYCNDALYGGIHNPDQIAIMPVFHEGEIIAWALSAAHQPETGAIEPGGMPVSARSRYDEGMRLTPIRIGENYRLRDDLLEMMSNMVGRAPRMQMLDVRARVAACDRIRVRLQELAAKRGVPFLHGLFRRMLSHTEAAVRERIGQWNDGTYRHTVFSDTIGLDDALLRVSFALIKHGDEITIDLTGSSPENEGSYHCYLHIVRAAAAVYLYLYPFHDFPLSSGAFAPLHFVAPQGCVFNASHDAAVANSVFVMMNLWQPLAVTFGKMMFDSPTRELVCASINSAAFGAVVAGENQYGVRVTDSMSYALNAQGGPARFDADGIDCFGFSHGPHGKGADVEDLENDQPHLHLFMRMLADSCGHGKYRGGAGLSAAYAPHLVPRSSYQQAAKESKFPSHSGLFGGYPHAIHPGLQVRHSNLFEKLAQSALDLPTSSKQLMRERTISGAYTVESKTRRPRILERGDLFIVNVAGGGGYGDVLERDPQALMEDLRKGAVSPWAIEQVYRVAYNPATLKVDDGETQRRRQAARARRKEQALPYAEFVAAWSRRRPPEGVLRYFGSWPDGAPNRLIHRI